MATTAYRVIRGRPGRSSDPERREPPNRCWAGGSSDAILEAIHSEVTLADVCVCQPLERSDVEDRSTNRDATRKPNNLQRKPNNLQRKPNNLQRKPNNLQRWVQLPLQFAPIPQVFGPAHNIKLRASDRHPVGKWRFVAWPQLDDVAAHVEQGGLFGTVPSTFALSGGLHLSALDVDRGDASKLTDAYPALASIPSWQPGRMHCYYPDTVERPSSGVVVWRRRRRAYGAPMDFSRTTERGR